MPLTVDWPNATVHVPKSYLTLDSGTLYRLDTNQFRLDLKALEETIQGMAWPLTHYHNTEYTIAGVTYARSVQMLYKVEFEDGQYTVILEGSNNNIWDVDGDILVQNQVQVIAQNAAGLIVKTVGSGVTEQDKTDIISGAAEQTWAELTALHADSDSFGELVQSLMTVSKYLALQK